MAPIWCSGKGVFRYADLYLPRWFGPDPLSVCVACSQGSETVVVDPPGTPLVIWSRNTGSRPAAAPAAWVVIETCPAEWWYRWSRANRPANGLDGELWAAMKRP